MREIYALDPDETWEIDYSLEVARANVRIWTAVTAEARKAGEGAPGDLALREQLAAAEAALAAAEKDLAAYVPGSGPVFVVGHIPAAKRPEIQGLGIEMAKAAQGSTERLLADFGWQREVARWSIRGHRNLRRRSGVEVPFVSDQIAFDGADRDVVSRTTLEVYGQTGLLAGIAGLGYLAIEPQRLPDVEKNA